MSDKCEFCEADAVAPEVTDLFSGVSLCLEHMIHAAVDETIIAFKEVAGVPDWMIDKVRPALPAWIDGLNSYGQVVAKTTVAETILKSAGKPELGTMAVCVKCGQEVVYKLDFDDALGKLAPASWWALVDPDGDEDPFLCRPRGGALTMHSVDPGVEQS
jgi:hypothetical protein